MLWFRQTLEIHTQGKGLYPITPLIDALIQKWEIQQGMCYLFIPHTSASLILNENYDSSAKADLENFLEKLVPRKPGLVPAYPRRLRRFSCSFAQSVNCHQPDHPHRQ